MSLCECGCGETTRLAAKNDARHGTVKGRPLRFVSGHQGRAGGVPRVAGHVVAESGCWLWQGATDAKGYGRLERDGHYLAHRWYYEQRHGPGSAGAQLDHRCRVPSCVNPDHLEPVTGTENVRRGRSAKLSVETARVILASSEDALTLARRYGVSRSTIYGVRHRRQWRDVEPPARDAWQERAAR